MVHLEQKQNARTSTLSNDQVLIILDALESQMQRYNEASDIIGTSANHARQSIREAVTAIREVHKTFCEMMDPEEEEGNELPENVLVRLNYAGQALHTTKLEPLPEVDVNGALPYPVTYIRMDYPFEIEGNGDYNVYKIAPAKTWGELLTETVKVFQREYNAGKAIAPHVLTDYIIERIDIHPGDLATIWIGS